MSGLFLKCLITGAVLLLFIPGSAAAWEEDPASAIIWPMRIRDLMPLSVTSLGFMPSSGHALPKGGWAMEVHLSHSNTFIMSDSIKKYLQERDLRAPLTAEDINTIRNTYPGDLFYYDGEWGLLSMGFHYGLTDQINLSANFPFHIRGGGFFDKFIEGFHNTFGLGQSGRDVMGRDINQIYFSFEEHDFLLLSAQDSADYGDPSFGFKFAFPNTFMGWHLSLETAFKVPIAKVDRFYSTGSTDLGLQFAASRRIGRHAWHGNCGYVWVGDFEDGENFQTSNIPSLTFSYQYLLSPTSTIISQLTWSQSIFKGNTHSELTDDEFQISFGYRIRRGQTIYSAAFTENLANYDNTPDIGFHLSAYFLFGDSMRLTD